MILEQKQTLKMMMTQELRQAIELLQLSTYELFQYIQQQAEENPFIEFIEKDHEHSNRYQKGKLNFTKEQHQDALHATAGKEKTMHERLLEQIILFPVTKKEQQVLRYLVLNINEQGFLSIQDEEVIDKFSLGEEELSRVKRYLHKLEPIGIGSANLIDCLSLQAMRAFPKDDLLLLLIQEHLKDLADRRWEKLAKLLNITMQQINDAYERIKMLNPRPANAMGNTETEYVTPDLSIHLDEAENNYIIQLHDHYIPNIHFNYDYSNTLPKTSEVAAYVQDHFKKFQWLNKSIRQRRDTIMKIMNVIVARQQDFFQDGFRALKPLTLKDIAEEIEMHESTISRATANKIVQTPLGTMELKQLFSTRLNTSAGNETSQSTVKEMIKEVIQDENKHKPLSDQKIADLLTAMDKIVISRRTVAKYREEMQIPSSSKRKEIMV